MAFTVEAVYEDGVLKPTQPLPLKEHEKVEITVCSKAIPLADSHGILGWKGDHETLERFALDAGLDPPEDVRPERSPLLEAYGIMGFKGTSEDLEYFALDPSLDPNEDD